MNQDPPLPPRATLTVKEAAALLGFSTNSIYKFLNEKRIQAKRIGKGRFRIPREEIERFLRHGKHRGHETEQSAAVPVSVTAEPVPVAASVPSKSIAPALPFAPLVGTPDMFDWYIGMTLVLLGLAYLFLPGDPRFVGNALLIRLLAIVLGAIGLGFLWVDVTETKRRSLLVASRVAVIMSLLAAALPYLIIGNWAGLALIMALVSVSLLYFLGPPLSAEQQFLLLVLFLGIFVGVFFLPNSFLLSEASPLSFGPFQRFLFVVLWSALLLGLLALMRWSTTRALFWVQVSLFGLVGLITLGWTMWYVSRGLWDHVALTLSLGTFAALFPFRDRIEHLSVRRQYLVTLVFVWVGVLLLAGMITMRLVQQQLERSYARSAEVAAEQAREEVTRLLQSGERAVQAQTLQPALAAALKTGSTDVLLPLARTTYETSGGALSGVFITNGAGDVLARYPVGTLSALEERVLQATARTAITTHAGTSLQTIVDEEGADRPVTVLAQPVMTVDGTLQGVVVAFLDQLAIQQRLSDLQFRDNGTILVADRQGIFLFHPNPALVGEDVSVDDEFFDAIRGQTGVTKGLSQGVSGTYLKALQAVPELGWGIVAQYPLTEVYQFGNRLAVFALLSTLAMAWGSFAVLLWALRPAQRASIPS